MRTKKPSTPKEQALRLLARREHSAKELAMKLKRKSREHVVADTLSADSALDDDSPFAADAIGDAKTTVRHASSKPAPINTDELISELQADHYQSDERFARVLVRRRAGDGYGPVRIRAELKTHGIPGPMIELAFDSAEVDWEEVLDRLLQRQHKLAHGSRQDQMKLAAKLQQRGFSGEAIRSALRRLPKASEDAADAEDSFD